MAEHASQPQQDVEGAETDFAEITLFQVQECYVYKIPPRKTAASYRADEWDINKWQWEGALRVTSKGEECRIVLEDNKTGELFAQAPLRKDQPLPVEAVIDSSRFFVLRIEDSGGPSSRHAFIGVGFRERPQAYDFQAALYDHIKYLNKKKEAEEMEQEYLAKPAVDWSLKEGQTIRLSMKTKPSSSAGLFFDNAASSDDSDSPPRTEAPSGLMRTASGSPSPPSRLSVPILPPPPYRSPSSTPLGIPPPSTAGVEAAPFDVNFIEAVKAGEEEDFGDFQGAA